jgi:ribulose-bisphosphate carboxylase large chain
MEWVRAQTQELAVMGHPALSGVFFQDWHGISPDLLLGDLMRLLGMDAVIFPKAGGRFPLDLQTCYSIRKALTRPLGTLAPAFPVPAGGITLDNLRRSRKFYGQDVMFLVGGSLRGSDIRNTVENFLEELGDDVA